MVNTEVGDKTMTSKKPKFIKTENRDHAFLDIKQHLELFKLNPSASNWLIITGYLRKYQAVYQNYNDNTSLEDCIFQVNPGFSDTYNQELSKRGL
jgi:hypothetical protein